VGGVLLDITTFFLINRTQLNMNLFFFGLLLIAVSYSQITPGTFQGTLSFRNTLTQVPPFISPCCDEIYVEPVTVIATVNSLNFSSPGVTRSCGPSPPGWFIFRNLVAVSGSPNCYVGNISVSAGLNLGLGRIFYDGRAVRTALFGNSDTADCAFSSVNLTCTGNADSFFQPIFGVIDQLSGPANLVPVNNPGTLTFRHTRQSSPPFSAPCCSELYTEDIQFVTTSNSITISSGGVTASCGASPSGSFSFENLLKVGSVANCYVGDIFISPTGGSKTSLGQGRIFYDGNNFKTAVFGNSATADCNFPANNILECSGGNSTFYQPLNGFAAPVSPVDGPIAPSVPTLRPITPYSGISGPAVVGILIAIYFVIIVISVILCLVICKSVRK